MSEAYEKRPKPLGQKAYGSIGHLVGSRMGPGDHAVHDGQARICCEQTRDKHDTIYVQEKLDGSCTAVAHLPDGIVALGRAGYPAATSPYPQHHLFAEWVAKRESLFKEILHVGERLCGEWLAQAHSTRYELTHEPWVAFDLMVGSQRLPLEQFRARIGGKLLMPYLVHEGAACSIEKAMSTIGAMGFHGALDAVEGAVWRVERKGKVDFLAKYVRPEKQDGIFLPEISGKEAIWNWRPADG